MGEEFYSAIKLITGEEIFALVSIDENDGDPIIILQNPVIIKVTTNHMGNFVKIKPWLEIPDDDFIIIKYDKIITMTEVKEGPMIRYYKKYLSDDVFTEDYQSNNSGKVKVSNKMGFISTVKDAREALEKIFNMDFKDNKEI